MKNSIFFYQAVIPHYRVSIWKRLNDALDNRLVVVYGQSPSDFSHIVEAKFPFPTCRVRNYWLAGKRFMFQPFWQPFLEHGRPEVVISSQNPRMLSLFSLFAYCRMASIPVILYGHGGSRKRLLLSSHLPADVVHKWLIRHCDAFVCYTDEIRDELSHITNPDKLFVARNTLDTDILFTLRRELEKEGIENVRQRLGLTKSDHYLCFIGRLLKDKQVDLMLRAIANLRARGYSMGGVVIGDGPQRHSLEKLAKALDLKDVQFTGAIKEWARSAPYLYACDMLVNPGCVGLSVNHALSFGLPVVTQEQGENGPFHGPEVAFIELGTRGLFAKNQDLDDLCARILLVLENKAAMRQNCIHYAQEKLDVGNMIKGHLQAIEWVNEVRKS